MSDERTTLYAALAFGGFEGAEETERVAAWAAERIARLEAEGERMRGALTHLMAFGKRLMNSDVMEERAIGCCICEGARIIEEES